MVMEDIVKEMEEVYELDVSDTLKSCAFLVQEALEHEGNDGYEFLMEKLTDSDLDNPEDARDVTRYEMDRIKEVLIKKINKEEVEDFFEKNKEEIEEEIESRVEFYLDAIIRNTDDWNIRIELYSNYDCTNSFMFETRGETIYLGENYLESCLSFCKLNPAELKKIALEKSYKTSGTFRTKKSAEVFDEKDFFDEYENLSCPASLFTIISKVSNSELMEILKGNKKIVVPKGSKYGFYSDSRGGGSVFDAETKNDLVLDISKTFKTKYDSIGIIIDDEKNSYSLKSCFGITNEFFKGEIKCLKK